MKPSDLIQALAVVVIWGFNFVVIKTAVSEIPPLTLTALRFTLVALLISAFCWAWANVLIKRRSDIHPLTIIGWMSLLAIPILVVCSLLFESDQWHSIQGASWSAWAALGYIVIASSILAYYLWYRLIARLSINQVAPFSLLAPMIGVAAGILILDEALTLYKVIGGTLTIAGVGLIELRQARLRRLKLLTPDL